MSQAWIDHSLDELEALLERLFARCDQVLDGDTHATDLAPLQKDVARRLTRLQSEMRVEGVGDSASGDRLRAIAERFDNLQRYWGRLTERMKSSPRPPPPDSDPGELLVGTERPARPSHATPPFGTPAVHVSSHAPPPSTPSSITPERVRQIQKELSALDPVSGRVSIDRLTKLLRETEASLRARHGDRAISFKVVLKGKKAVIKPVVR